jgi:hypothetical protein
MRRRTMMMMNRMMMMTTIMMMMIIYHVFEQVVIQIRDREQDLNVEQCNQRRIVHRCLEQTSSIHHIDEPIDRHCMTLLVDNKCHMVYQNNLFHHQHNCLQLDVLRNIHLDFILNKLTFTIF